MNRCVQCSKRLSALARSDARFCSDRCRVRWHRAGPSKSLRSIPRWVRYSAEKVPLTVAGSPASSTNPATWTDFESVSASSVGVGFGFVLSDSDRIVCVDIDHCLDSRGRALPWAAELLGSIPATYVEVSPSGTGVHVWGFGDVSKGSRSNGIEVYGTGRYITVTGRRWRNCGSRFAELSGWLP